MKKFLLLFFVIFSGLSYADAQWYYKSCGVADINNCTPSEFDCLWNNASKIAHGGAITTGIGTSLVAIGAILTVASGFTEAAHATVTLSMVGLIIDMIGVPVWITGANRKSSLRKSPLYEALNSGSLNLSPTINRNQFTNTYSLGISASLSF